MFCKNVLAVSEDSCNSSTGKLLLEKILLVLRFSTRCYSLLLISAEIVLRSAGLFGVVTSGGNEHLESGI